VNLSLQWYEYVTVAFIAAVVVILSFFPLLYFVRRWERNRDRRIGGASPDGRWELEQAMRKLQDQFEDLREESARKVHEYEREISNLKFQIDTLFKRWQETIKQLGIVEQENYKLQMQISTLQAAQPPREARGITGHLLAAIGTDPDLDVDMAVLRGVRQKYGLQFTRLKPVTKRNFKATLDRYRSDGRKIESVHLAVHAGPEGVEFGDGLADGVWLSEQLVGVQRLLLASCDAHDVGDLLAVVPAVITMGEDITSADARIFTETFWSAIGMGKDTSDAFDYALLHSPPGIQEYAYLHV
jgi:hypothetical protein